MSRFIQTFSQITTPLRELTKKNSKFIWTDRQDQAFNLLKKGLISNSIVSFFDPDRPCTVWVDASNFAIGDILLQPDDQGHLVTLPVHYQKLNRNTQ